MDYYSTGRESPSASLAQATLTGLAPDGGLYLPRVIPRLSAKMIEKFRFLSFTEVALELAKMLFAGDIATKNLRQIVNESMNFPVNLKKLDNNLWVLELFHGPTLSFKDFGARFMARLTSALANSNKKTTTVMVATSGDTGSAVAAGFYNVPQVKVIILYPKGKVSPTQELQLTTMGGNIITLEIEGTFDDCQKLIKEAFLDKTLKRRLTLTSANSINIARLLPQVFYYFYAWAQLPNKARPVVFSIPCGNLGNFTAGVLAKKMGLPKARLVAATNINDVFTHFVQTGAFKPKPAKQTLSNAMDVGNPNNLARIRELYQNNLKLMQKDIFSKSFTDEETVQAIREVDKRYHYILDPHSAVAYLGLKAYIQQNQEPSSNIFLATAHPAKFPETIERALKQKVALPKNLKEIIQKKKKTIALSNLYSDFKNYLLTT